MQAINHQSKLPLYHQLFEVLHDDILSGKLKPGDMLPSESELIEKYGVSRITVRKVFDMLVKEGLIHRERGRGSFVSQPRLEHGLSRIVNFTEDMLQRGFKPGTEVLYIGTVEASEYVAEKLNVPVNEELVRLDRLRLADNEPMCVEHAHLVARYFPDIAQYDFAAHSLREIKTNVYGIRWSRATQVIRAMLASEDIAHLLDIDVNSPLLYIERISYSQDNIPMEYLKAYYRSDRYTLYNELQGGAG